MTAVDVLLAPPAELRKEMEQIIETTASPVPT